MHVRWVICFQNDRASLSAVHGPEEAGRAASLVAVQTGRCMETPRCQKGERTGGKRGFMQ
eukprot:7223595-Pyramimonas_sp.AAC.1